MRPSLAAYEPPRRRIEETCQLLIDLLHPGFAARPRRDIRMKILLLANEAIGLTADGYARTKAEGVIRWASIALSPHDDQGWHRRDAEAFAMEEAWRLWRRVRTGS